MTSPAPRVLLVAHDFPPSGAGSFVLRAVKLAKFLPRHGWRVTVLTTQAELSQRLFGVSDPTLLADLSPEVEVLRVPSPEATPRRRGLRHVPLLGWLPSLALGPGPSATWGPAASRAARAHARRSPVDVVLADGPPFASLVVGARIANALRVPLVIHLRDPWCQQGLMGGRVDRFWERRTLAASARAVFVTEGMRRLYEGAYPGLAERFRVVEHGVDLEDESWRTPVALDRTRFEIVYAGTFFRASAPRVLFAGLARACALEPEFRALARLVWVGPTPRHPAVARELEDIERLGLGPLVERTGLVSHREAIARQRRAGVLLLLVHASHIQPSKTYEYVAAGRPILAVAPEGGEADRALRDVGRAVRADPRDPDDVAAKLLALFARWRRGDLSGLAPPAPPETLSYAHRIGQMSDVLREAIGVDR